MISKSPKDLVLCARFDTVGPTKPSHAYHMHATDSGTANRDGDHAAIARPKYLTKLDSHAAATGGSRPHSPN